MEDLVVSLRIEEDNLISDKRVVNQCAAKANMVEQGKKATIQQPQQERE